MAFNKQNISKKINMTKIQSIKKRIIKGECIVEKSWYPIIDYQTCLECGACVDKCSHGVFEKGKKPLPVVLNPKSCIDHCHGCGNLCPAGAITYMGEDTNWVPPALKQQKVQPNYPCKCGVSHKKKVLIEYLYLDLESCDRCIGTDTALDEVMMTLTPALCLANYEVKYRKIEISTAQQAEQYQLLSSPTIRLNGKDLFGNVKENSCSCCSKMSGSEIDCRIFDYEGVSYEVPPKEMMAEAILRTVFSESESGCSYSSKYKLPENLKSFFEGKKSVKKCSCRNGCC